MSLQLEPPETLTFRRPFTRTSKEVLKLRNPSNEEVAFKVKTTAPKLYCVRPNAGIVPANGSVEVQVMLQPFKEEPPLEERSKDRFLVLSVPMKADFKSMELTDFWHHVETSAKNTIQQVKLQCRFVHPDEEKSSMERSASESTAVSAGRSVSERPISLNDDDTISQLRMELDNYKNELEALRCRPPDTTTVGSARAFEMAVSLPVVALVVLFSTVVSYLLFKQ